jgi:hypothetical protein
VRCGPVGSLSLALKVKGVDVVKAVQLATAKVAQTGSWTRRALGTEVDAETEGRAGVRQVQHGTG